MESKFSKLKNYIIEEKKQIIFALFAFIIFLITKENNNPEVMMNVVSASVAAAAKVAAKAAGKAALKGAATGAAKGAVDGAVNKDPNEGALKSMAKGAAGGAISGAKSGAMNSVGSSIKGLKNTNPNQAKSPENLNNATPSADAKKNDKNSSTSGLNDKKNDKNKKKNSDTSFNMRDEEEENPNGKIAKKIAKRALLTPMLGMGCVIGLLFTLILAVPILMVSITNPIANIVNQFECTDDETGLCATKGAIGDFFEKIKNLFVYQNFDKNEEVISEKVNEVYKDILLEYEVSIDIPALVSTILADAEELGTEIDENGNETANKLMLSRLEYLKEVAMLQVGTNEVAYTCKSKDVNGTLTYYKETNYNVSDLSILTEGVCDSTTVGSTFKEVINGVNIENYYEKLKNEKDLLKKLYPNENIDDEVVLNRIIETIKLRKDGFLELYSEEDENKGGLGNVPMSLFYDPNVSLSSPLKGNIGVTSPYGQRTGIFAGMHVGIDLVSGDKTVYAAGNGIVTRANTETEGGNVIEITHTDSNNNKYITLYAHLAQFLVAKGDNVESGDAIGIMGCTGTMCSGVHLHFQVMDGNRKTYNPANLIPSAN